MLCYSHIPKAKATTVAETPELKRIAENTKLQSNVIIDPILHMYYNEILSVNIIHWKLVYLDLIVPGLFYRF